MKIDSVKDRYASLSTAALKRELAKHGLDSLFCFNKEDLIARLLEANVADASSLPVSSRIGVCESVPLTPRNGPVDTNTYTQVKQPSPTNALAAQERVRGRRIAP